MGPRTRLRLARVGRPTSPERGFRGLSSHADAGRPGSRKLPLRRVGDDRNQAFCQSLDLMSLVVKESWLLASAGPSWCRIVAPMHRPVRGIRPGDNIADVPDRASCQPRDRRREGGRAPSLPDVHGVRLYSEHEPDLLRACEIPGVVHSPTIGGLVSSLPACRRHKPTESSYTTGMINPSVEGASLR